MKNNDVLNSIFENIDALVYRCNNDDNYTMSSLIGQAEKITGYPVEDILGNRRVSWVGITHKDDLDRVCAAVDEAIEANTSWDVDYRLVSPNGEYKWVRERGCAVYEDGELTYLQGMVVSAEAELELRETAQSAAATAELEKRDIVEIAQVILSSIRMLSMLSINARIEAARFGESGKGFGIIAEEIGTLAQQNETLARQITDKIKSDKSCQIRANHVQPKAA